FAVGLMRAAFEWALNFAKTEKRGGAAPIISHQAVGYALADAKMAIEAVRSLSLRAAHAFDTHAARRTGTGATCEGVRVGDSGTRDYGPYARRWHRQLRSHAAARRPARRRALITAVRWREHGRSATAAARADANAGLRPAYSIWQLR